MASEIDAEGEVVEKGRGAHAAVGIGELALNHRISIDLGAEDVVLGEGVAPLGTDVGREDVAEARARKKGSTWAPRWYWLPFQRPPLDSHRPSD